MFEAFAQMLRDEYRLDAVKVLSMRDRTIYGGGCETCAYEYAVCDVTYLDSKGKTLTYQLTESFSELVGYLGN